MSDFAVRWQKSFAYYFPWHDEMSAHFREVMASDPPGTSFDDEDINNWTSAACASEDEKREFEPQLPGRQPAFVPFSYWGQGDEAQRALGRLSEGGQGGSEATPYFHGLTQKVRLFNDADNESGPARASQKPLAREIAEEELPTSSSTRYTEDELCQELSVSIQELCHRGVTNDFATVTLKRNIRRALLETSLDAAGASCERPSSRAEQFGRDLRRTAE
mmetsp:Transcript_20605/g.50805  ORF Transcript_20605/g.50805 Transcript_20605/m.50805 type:complete len:219 (-) Transcript_20605:87-743(-)